MRNTNNPMRSTDRLHNCIRKKVYSSYVSNDIKVLIDSDEDKETIKHNKELKDEKKKIFDIINDGVYGGKSILGIIEQLNSVDKFKNYRQYFGTWIEDQIIRKKDIESRILKEKEKGCSDEEIIAKLYNVQKWKKEGKYFKSLVYGSVNKDKKGIEQDDR